MTWRTEGNTPPAGEHVVCVQKHCHPLIMVLSVLLDVLFFCTVSFPRVIFSVRKKGMTDVCQISMTSKQAELVFM